MGGEGTGERTLLKENSYPGQRDVTFKAKAKSLYSTRHLNTNV